MYLCTNESAFCFAHLEQALPSPPLSDNDEEPHEDELVEEDLNAIPVENPAEMPPGSPSENPVLNNVDSVSCEDPLTAGCNRKDDLDFVHSGDIFLSPAPADLHIPSGNVPTVFSASGPNPTSSSNQTVNNSSLFDQTFPPLPELNSDALDLLMPNSSNDNAYQLFDLDLP